MEHYTKANPLRCFFAFAGYDSQAMAMERIKQMHPDFDYRITGWCEIDPHAIRLHNACFPEASRNYGDISKIDWSQVPDFDLFTMSSPCQDFSTAGLQRGGEEGSGTRSSLLWECRKTVIAKRPKYILLENVKGLTNHKNIHGLHRWMRELEGYGYENHAKILNAADYGIPQNRERIFMLSILRDTGDTFTFPNKQPLTLRIRDLLEKGQVAERYYCSPAQEQRFKEQIGRAQDGDAPQNDRKEQPRMKKMKKRTPRCLNYFTPDGAKRSIEHRVYSAIGEETILTIVAGNFNPWYLIEEEEP